MFGAVELVPEYVMSDACCMYSDLMANALSDSDLTRSIVFFLIIKKRNNLSLYLMSLSPCYIGLYCHPCIIGVVVVDRRCYFSSLCELSP